jgi:two-component system, OmpR family, sensor histidine kinase VanS
MLNNNRKTFMIIVWIVGAGLIFIYYWIKTLGYLEYIIKATESIYDSKEDYIILPSELKEIENQMNRIKVSIRQNERAAKEAEQRKNDLVVYLAHDLKTPLTSVIGYLSLLRDEGQISEELRNKYLSISLDKAERLEDLINEFFEITRFNLTNLTLELSRVNLSRMLEQIVYETGPILRMKDLTCHLEAEPDISIKCDVNKMQRVFDNLLRNAVNYSFEGSAIEIIVKDSVENITFEFRNHGNTIPEEKLNRIFEQFYRLDTARQSKTGGSGLGLAIAKEIVELHKGTITAYSRDEVISFQIVLPKVV